MPLSALSFRESSVARTEVAKILPLRDLHRQEMNCQIIHDSFALRGLSDPYAVTIDGHLAGYGLVANQYYEGAVCEFYLQPPYRRAALPIFHQLLEASRATHIRTQTNDRQLLLMLYDCAENIVKDNYLFADSLTTSLPSPGGALRKSGTEGQEEWVLELDGQPVAAGGLMFHYNPPYGDIYMEVNEAHRRQGFGSYMVQELKRIAYEIGKIPAARCSPDNLISRQALEKAGMLPCGRILQGQLPRR
ncbi:MAG TPA: GNAT family N-acetyltransferase [Bryobacteraceae bacterium]